MVAVAQLVEHRIVIPVVAGSIPVSHPIFQKAVQADRLFYVCEVTLLSSGLTIQLITHTDLCLMFLGGGAGLFVVSG
jgi:hypothetical protein